VRNVDEHESMLYINMRTILRLSMRLTNEPHLSRKSRRRIREKIRILQDENSRTSRDYDRLLLQFLSKKGKIRYCHSASSFNWNVLSV